MKVKPPAKDVSITITLTETTEGRLNISASIPVEAEGTIGLIVADIALAAIRDAMRVTFGQEPPMMQADLQ